MKPDTNPTELQRGALTEGGGLKLSIGPRAPSAAHGGLHYNIIMKKGPFAVVDCSKQ